MDQNNYRKDLIKDFTAILKKQNRGLVSNTHDFILADYLVRSLEVFERAARMRSALGSYPSIIGPSIETEEYNELKAEEPEKPKKETFSCKVCCRHLLCDDLKERWKCGWWVTNQNKRKGDRRKADRRGQITVKFRRYGPWAGC